MIKKQEKDERTMVLAFRVSESTKDKLFELAKPDETASLLLRRVVEEYIEIKKD